MAYYSTLKKKKGITHATVQLTLKEKCQAHKGQIMQHPTCMRNMDLKQSMETQNKTVAARTGGGLVEQGVTAPEHRVSVQKEDKF